MGGLPQRGGAMGPWAPGKGTVLLVNHWCLTVPYGAWCLAHGTLFVRPWAIRETRRKEKNGYPFTTFTDSSRLSWDNIHESLVG